MKQFFLSTINNWSNWCETSSLQLAFLRCIIHRMIFLHEFPRQTSCMTSTSDSSGPLITPFLSPLLLKTSSKKCPRLTNFSAKENIRYDHFWWTTLSFSVDILKKQCSIQDFFYPTRRANSIASNSTTDRTSKKFFRKSALIIATLIKMIWSQENILRELKFLGDYMKRTFNERSWKQVELEKITIRNLNINLEPLQTVQIFLLLPDKIQLVAPTLLNSNFFWRQVKSSPDAKVNCLSIYDLLFFIFSSLGQLYIRTYLLAKSYGKRRAEKGPVEWRAIYRDDKGASLYRYNSTTPISLLPVFNIPCGGHLGQKSQFKWIFRPTRKTHTWFDTVCLLSQPSLMSL